MWEIILEVLMVRPTRFERVTAGTANQCSIQLSYERTPSLLRGRNYSILNLKLYKDGLDLKS